MSEQNPLYKAHMLSAQASLLVKPLKVPLQSLEQALSLYKQAEELYSSSSDTVKDEGAKKTLVLLTAQHRNFIKDVERRISNIPKSPTVPAEVQYVDKGEKNGVLPLENTQISNANIQRTFDSTISGKISSSTSQKCDVDSKERTLSPTRGIPPFSIRPTSFTSTAVPGQGQSIRRPTDMATSTLQSSSSSSSTDESFVHFGIPDSSDPFLRFWGMLENALTEVSKPVAFASMPLDVPRVPRPAGYRERKKSIKKKGKEKGKDRETASPNDSYYVVSAPESEDKSCVSIRYHAIIMSRRLMRFAWVHFGFWIFGGIPQKVQAPGLTYSTSQGKTPEELELENVSLRASLDALASHAHTLEQTNKMFRAQAEERERNMRNVMLGVRREAVKVKQDQDLMRSQLFASTTQPPRQPRLSTLAETDGSENSASSSLQKRIRDLEEEVKGLRIENEKQKGQIDKYKERFEKIKSNAREKRDAKLAKEGRS
ncbi:hypothetical protein TREMEDRAFT_66106 [Tremella mesenterica DSM 1558]|uniref:uncharacterized protein n=1 Tax=Tremella mesenterica (strain ATCC 24925 / CBS 8224 / DSM 1558 / NBRC 9311 / NRRL Y-6157 / RJB 2259-6 / UBC 559-6) TaxID=578456 RepID=UPI00032C9214|nr:uncharacterized protein TREMEDRAFT_66106 [Tremella mesenterica DSM 1558]EIW65729.1 hypothetical protein TREMEDRAFT_66106 [Tremella mesenterica DSM 1558]